jgi:farnesyl-diphosphate farnesyltransferase
MSEDDWSYCQRALVQHSRSFALPIGGLPDGLRQAVTCAYLLCRVADTVEDTADWGSPVKERLQRTLLDVLETSLPAAEFERQVGETPGGDEAERALLLSLGRVVGCFQGCRPAFVDASRAWISELIRGMCIYSRRAPGGDGIVCLESESDLDRYCYFVAGTIGRLLTESFLVATSLSEAGRVLTLRENAERFAAGLQYVNILRDIGADLGRGHCFIPRTTLAREGLGPSELLNPECRISAHRALAPLFDAAEAHLDAAFAYTLALPRSAREIRSFCAIPLWMAVATLERCRQDQRLLEPGHRVKLSRAEVSVMVTQCTSAAGDDDALRRSFLALRKPSSTISVSVS